MGIVPQLLRLVVAMSLEELKRVFMSLGIGFSR